MESKSIVSRAIAAPAPNARFERRAGLLDWHGTKSGLVLIDEGAATAAGHFVSALGVGPWLLVGPCASCGRATRRRHVLCCSLVLDSI